MTSKNDSILVFEYFTASGIKDKSIITEAEALLYCLLDDLSDFNVDLVINKSYKNIINKDNINPIFIDCDVIDWLKDNASSFTRAIFIAGENNNNLYNITKILEYNNVKLYTSSSKACLITSDKYETFMQLKGIVPQPETSKLIDNIKSYDKIIAKPINGVDCENIHIITDLKDFNQSSQMIFQEYIEGVDVSVSLISDGVCAVPISLNRQYIDLEDKNYLGGITPYESVNKDKIFNIAVNAVENIKGLKGFVGVDLKVNGDEIYFLEINSRFTTPYVGVKKIANINIAKSIINIIDKKIDINDLNISLKGKIEFKKLNDSLEIRRI